MLSENGETSPSLIDVATQRASQVERAVSHVARAVELELADIALMNGRLDEEAKDKLIRLGGELVKISRGVHTLLEGIIVTAGVAIDRDTIYLESSTQSLPLPIELDRDLSSPDRPIATPEPLGHVGAIEGPSKPIPSPDASVTPLMPPVISTQESGLKEAVRPSAASGDSISTASGGYGKERVTEFYARIISIENIPNMSIKEGAPVVEVSIQDNTTLVIGQHIVELYDHERYIFNKLMILRDKPRAASELRQSDFYPGGKRTTAGQVFSKEISNLSAKLNTAAGLEVIKHIGNRRSSRYAVNPNVVLQDLRTDEQRQEVISVKKK